MTVLVLILLLVALGCFIAAALGAAIQRINLIALGLACWALVFVIRDWPS